MSIITAVSPPGKAILIILSVLLHGQAGWGATFTLINKCSQTVWPAILGSPTLDTTGFSLANGESHVVSAPAGWSGRFWARTSCQFDESGRGSCATGDCGSREMECNGAGASAATLAEFTLGSNSMDFYDVSLVDGYNLPVTIEPDGGSGQCASTGCVDNLNQKCPSELKTEDGGACRSACDAFDKAEYCCRGAYGSPATCKPSAYSQLFKSACPKSYSYAYDDATSTFTCSGADYVITFCPTSLPSQKSWKSNGNDTGSGAEGATQQQGDESWLADLAAGGANKLFLGGSVLSASAMAFVHMAFGSVPFHPEIRYIQ